MSRKVARRAAVEPFYVMEVLKAAREREAATGDVLHLEVGQPSTGAPREVVDAAAEAMASSPLHYTDAEGTSALRERIAGFYGERYGVDLDPVRVVVTTGASGACVLAFLACFDVGDRVAVCRPGYPCYRNMLGALGVEPVDLVVERAGRYQPTATIVEQAVRDHGGLDGLVVASPSNPTGTMLDAAGLRDLGDVCRLHGIRLVSDEIYHGITFRDQATTALAVDDEAVVVQSFSKYFSMTGWRLGWLVLPPDLVTPVQRLAQNLTVAPPTLPQLAAVRAFDCLVELDGHVQRYARNELFVSDGLRRCGLAPHQVSHATGAFYLWADVRDLFGADLEDSEVLAARWLDELGVAVTPGRDFDPVDGRFFVRFSYAGSTDDIREAMERLVRWTRARRRSGAISRRGR